MTTTIEENLGSAVVVSGRGFLLNNEMTDFDAIPFDSAGRAVPNAATGKRKFRRSALGSDATTVGGKRPMSSMTPVIVLQPDGGVLAGQIFLHDPLSLSRLLQLEAREETLLSAPL